MLLRTSTDFVEREDKSKNKKQREDRLRIITAIQ